MLIPDLILLAVVLGLGTWRLFAPDWRPKLRIAAVALGLLLATVQWVLCGFTWQELPAYLLVTLSALPSKPTGAVLRWIGHRALVGIAATCVGVWVLPAVPTLPPPDGRYAVATQVYRWTDAARDEPHTVDPTDRRSVIAQAWYPTARREHARGPARLAYIDGTDDLPDQVSVMPGFMLRRYGQIDTHAEALAPLAPSYRPWPVVIFSPGYGAPRAVYTGLATRLASRGFVVFALDHPYESAVTQLPDGRVVGTQEILLTGERDRTPYMARQQVVRVADVRFVIDQLAHFEALSPPLRGGRIDASKVAVIGHSFGGAASVAALSEDPRVVAAANIDGTPYGDLPDRTLTRPFLLLQSDHAETRHGDRFNNGNGKLLAAMTAPGFRYEIKRANHYSFTDAPFFVAPPGRWLLARVMGGGRGPTATQQAAADILAAFLTGPLTGAASDLAAMAARHPEVLGGPVARKAMGPGRPNGYCTRGTPAAMSSATPMERVWPGGADSFRILDAARRLATQKSGANWRAIIERNWVIGRNTFDAVLGFPEWPYGKTPVFVHSSRPLAPVPPQAVVERVSGSPVAIVSQLEARGVQHAYVDGGIPPEGHHDPVLKQQPTHLVHQGGPFGHHALAQTMKRLDLELLRGLQWHAPHAGTRPRLGNRRGVLKIILVRLHIRLNELRRQNPDQTNSGENEGGLMAMPVWAWRRRTGWTPVSPPRRATSTSRVMLRTECRA